jgi:hypothetical protein
MANSKISLCIPYSHKSVDEALVQTTFERVLADHTIVEKVDLLERTDNKNGKPYKMFFIHFNHSNDRLQYMLSQIDLVGHFNLTYGVRPDHVKGYPVETFWQVSAYKSKDKPDFVPRVLTDEEAVAAGIKSAK